MSDRFVIIDGASHKITKLEDGDIISVGDYVNASGDAPFGKVVAIDHTSDYFVQWYDRSIGIWGRENIGYVARRVQTTQPEKPDQSAAHVTGLDDLGLKGEVSVNEFGGKQTGLPHRLDLVPQAALFSVGRVLAPGAKKYGENNWRKTTVSENINHALGHLAAFLLGKRDEPHLGHAATRVMFALELEIEKQKKLDV